MAENETIEFEITKDYIELNKLLKLLGLCETGGQAKLAVENGLVKVDNETEARRGRKIRPGMKIEYNGTVILTK